MSEEYSTERLLREQGSLVHTIKGVSMMPLLDQNKDAVHLIPVNRELQKNDIVLFKRANGALVLHRIIKIREDGYVIRGDNCLGSELVPRKNIIAIADAVYKNGRYIPCNDKKLIKYAKKQPITWFFRYLKNIPRAVYHRIFRRKNK